MALSADERRPNLLGRARTKPRRNKALRQRHVLATHLDVQHRLKSTRLQREVCSTRGGLWIVAAQGKARLAIGRGLVVQRTARKGLVTQQRKECGCFLRTQALAGSCRGVAEALFQMGQHRLRSEFVQTRLDADRGGQRRLTKADGGDKPGTDKA